MKHLDKTFNSACFFFLLESTNITGKKLTAEDKKMWIRQIFEGMDLLFWLLKTFIRKRKIFPEILA